MSHQKTILRAKPDIPSEDFYSTNHMHIRGSRDIRGGKNNWLIFASELPQISHSCQGQADSIKNVFFKSSHPRISKIFLAGEQLQLSPTMNIGLSIILGYSTMAWVILWSSSKYRLDYFQSLFPFPYEILGSQTSFLDISKFHLPQLFFDIRLY